MLSCLAFLWVSYTLACGTSHFASGVQQPYRLKRISRPVCARRLSPVRQPLSRREKGEDDYELQTERVKGGEFVTDEEFAAYNVRLEFGNRMCSGSVIARRWILTAAHCGVKPGDTAYIGEHNKKRATTRTVKKVYRYPMFTRKSKFVFQRYDIALVYLAEAIPNIENTAVALNSNHFIPSNTYGRLTGYGWYRMVNGSDKKLRFVDVPVLTQNQCRWELRNDREALRAFSGVSQLCTGKDPCGGGACPGDSGAPLVIRDRYGRLVQVAVANATQGKCKQGNKFPDIFSKVSAYSAWIRFVTKGDATFVYLRL